MNDGLRGEIRQLMRESKEGTETILLLELVIGHHRSTHGHKLRDMGKHVSAQMKHCNKFRLILVLLDE